MNTFVVADPNKCIGCRTCQVACVVSHSEKDIFTSKISKIELYPRVSVVKTAQVCAPIQCRQCEDAPCANVCPNGSIISKGGVVYIDKDTCIGCKTCIMACPFGAMDLVPQYSEGEKILQNGLQVVEPGKLYFKEKMVGNKCDLCVGSDKGPACVEVCPTNAFKIVQSKELNESVKDKRQRRAFQLVNILVR